MCSQTHTNRDFPTRNMALCDDYRFQFRVCCNSITHRRFNSFRNCPRSLKDLVEWNFALNCSGVQRMLLIFAPVFWIFMYMAPALARAGAHAAGAGVAAQFRQFALFANRMTFTLSSHFASGQELCCMSSFRTTIAFVWQMLKDSTVCLYATWGLIRNSNLRTRLSKLI